MSSKNTKYLIRVTKVKPYVVSMSDLRLLEEDGGFKGPKPYLSRCVEKVVRDRKR